MELDIPGCHLRVGLCFVDMEGWGTYIVCVYILDLYYINGYMVEDSR
jgi:hypothetical protein